jgi:hypothetical protein
MDQSALPLLAEPRVHPGRRITATAAQVFIADGDGFVTTPVDELQLGFEGVPGDRHRGWTRPADARVPWYPRGTTIRNIRQISLLAPDELAEIARKLGLPEIRAGWLGGNVLLSGIARLSRLPVGTVLFFPSGATLRIEQMNGPCRLAGASVAEHYPDRKGLDTRFVAEAKGLRGLVASVEREGVIRSGDTIGALIPEQWIWEG